MGSSHAFHDMAGKLGMNSTSWDGFILSHFCAEPGDSLSTVIQVCQGLTRNIAGAGMVVE